MTSPRTLIFSGYGLNCEEETKAAFEMAGVKADIVHVNDLLASPRLLKQYQIAVLPGGFSYGDDTGAGQAYASRLKNHLGEPLDSFLTRDTLMLAICNGFQIAVAAGILPGALVSNDSARYMCRWVDVVVKGESPWLRGIKKLSLPIAHGEGNYVASQKTLAALKKEKAIALQYAKGDIAQHFNLPANPNGSTQNIAGITARSGRVLGLMPHPERAIRFTHLPHWTYVREECARKGEHIPTEGSGLRLFKNAARYFA